MSNACVPLNIWLMTIPDFYPWHIHESVPPKFKHLKLKTNLMYEFI